MSSLPLYSCEGVYHLPILSMILSFRLDIALSLLRHAFRQHLHLQCAVAGGFEIDASRDCYPVIQNDDLNARCLLILPDLI